MSRVDVIVPCYNYGRFLRECVESVLKQPVDVRVLIIDDASTDETPEIAAALACEDSRVEFRRHAQNQGHIATYNEGLEWVSGDYNLLLSADDLLVKGALLRASRLMDANPDVGLVYGRVIGFRSAPPPRSLQGRRCRRMGRYLRYEMARIDMQQWREPDQLSRGDRAKSASKELGGYRQQLPHTADMEMWMRFAVHSNVGRLKSPQAYYRRHEQNMSKTYSEKCAFSAYKPNTKDFFQRKAAFDLLFQEQGHALPDCDRLHRLAYECLAWNAFWHAHRLFDQGEAFGCRVFLGLAREVFPGIEDRPEWISDAPEATPGSEGLVDAESCGKGHSTHSRACFRPRGIVLKLQLAEARGRLKTCSSASRLCSLDEERAHGSRDRCGWPFKVLSPG